MEDTLYKLSQAIAAGLTQVRLEVSRMLSGLYVRGSRDKNYYGEAVYTGDIKRIIPQAYKQDLDKLGYMFSIPRRVFESDESYRSRIIFSVRVTTTVKGLSEVVRFTFENSEVFPATLFDVEVRESYKDSFDGITLPINAPLRSKVSHTGGIVVYIRPKSTVQLTDGRVMSKEEYEKLYPLSSNLKPGVVLSFTRNIDYKQIYSGGEFNSLKNMFNVMVAAGIHLDRIIFEQAGAGGNRGEYYAYEL